MSTKSPIYNVGDHVIVKPILIDIIKLRRWSNIGVTAVGEICKIESVFPDAYSLFGGDFPYYKCCFIKKGLSFLNGYLIPENAIGPCTNETAFERKEKVLVSVDKKNWFLAVFHKYDYNTQEFVVYHKRMNKKERFPLCIKIDGNEHLLK